MEGDPLSVNVSPLLGAIPDLSVPLAQTSSDTQGMRVGKIWKGSVAEMAGIRPGDLLTLIIEQEGERLHPVRSAEQFEAVVRLLRPGQKITLGIKRQDVDLRLSTQVAD